MPVSILFLFHIKKSSLLSVAVPVTADSDKSLQENITERGKQEKNTPDIMTPSEPL